MQAKLTTPLIAATEWRMERWQLAFDSLVFVFSLMLLPDLRHRCNYLVEKQSAVGSLVFAWLCNAHNRHQGEQIMP